MKKLIVLLFLYSNYSIGHAHNLSAFDLVINEFKSIQRIDQLARSLNDTNLNLTRRQTSIQFAPPDTVYYIQNNDSIKNKGETKMVMVYFGERTPSKFVPSKPIISHYEREAIFPGGDDSLRNFLESNLNWPTDTTVKGVYTCLILFEIDVNGNVNSVKVKESSGNDLMDDEAVRVILMLPKFEPAIKFGHRIKSTASIPITFEN